MTDEGSIRHFTPLLFVLSGPSGVGKDAVLNKLKESPDNYYFLVTATTRPRRQSEVDGIDYHFVNRAQFEDMMNHGELLEWANVYGNMYGTPKRPVREALTRGQDVILKVDVQGAASIKGIVPGAVFIFLSPPSLKELEERLRERDTESEQAMRTRIEAVRREMEQLPLFDYVVVNETGKAAEAACEIQAIIVAEKRRVQQRVIRL